MLNRPKWSAERTRRRVLAAIAELGFVRNESARQLRGGAQPHARLRRARHGQPVLHRRRAGAQDVRRGGPGVFLCDSEEAPPRRRYLDLLVQQRVQGVLITPVDPDSARLDRSPNGARRSSSSTEADGTDPARSPSTTSRAAASPSTHLLEGGHRRSPFVGGPAPVPQVADRLGGARGALRRAGAGRRPASCSRPPRSRRRGARGRRAPRRAARRADRPTAAFCANDLLALGLLQQLTRHGVRVPDDVAIVGYDDIEFAAAAAVPLTSVAQPRQQLGRTAAELLARRGDEAPEHANTEQSCFQPELVVRGRASTRLATGEEVA